MTAAFLSPQLKSFRSAVDVGCAAGFLLSTLRRAGIRRVCGIDPAADAPEAARSLFAIDVSTAHAETFDRYGEYDLVCLMAVLEHVLEPRRVLRTVAKQLKPGARVLIEVPDAGAFDRPGTGESIEPFGEFSNEHINFFSISDIRNLAHAAGMEVERWRPVRSINGLPEIFALLHKADAKPSLVDADPCAALSRVTSVESLERYVSRSLRVMQEVECRLRKTCQNEVLVYGAGNHTCRLLAQSATLAACRVPAVFDQNRHLHGEWIGDSRIMPPARMKEFPTVPVVVSTFNARREIHKAITGTGSRPAVLLYD